MLWEFLTDEAKLLTKVTLRSQKENPLGGDVWQVNAEKLVVEKSQVRERCTTCQRLATRTAPNRACTRHNCHGTTVTQTAGPGELRRVADGPSVRDGQRRGTHGPGARRGPQQDRAGFQVPNMAGRTAWWPRRPWRWASTSGPWTWP